MSLGISNCNANSRINDIRKRAMSKTHNRRVPRATATTRQALVPRLIPWKAPRHDPSASSVNELSLSSAEHVPELKRFDSGTKTPQNEPAAAPDRPTCERQSDVGRKRDSLAPMEQPPTVCFCCHQRRWWRSIYGPHLICAGCHPPSFRSVVAAWIPAVESREPILSGC